jgi:hypothetical protein
MDLDPDTSRSQKTRISILSDRISPRQARHGGRSYQSVYLAEDQVYYD